MRWFTPVLTAGEDRSKRKLDNYFVTLSFSAFSGKKLGSRKEKAFGEQLTMKSPSENDLIFALVKARQNIQPDKPDCWHQTVIDFFSSDKPVDFLAQEASLSPLRKVSERAISILSLSPLPSSPLSLDKPPCS